MDVKYIPSSDINSDLGIVNAARVSLGKHQNTLDEKKDGKLIKYLIEHNHWTPLAHSRLYFTLDSFDSGERLFFYEKANLAGFSILKIEESYVIKGSLYGFAMNLKAFSDERRRDFISDCIHQKYPIAAQFMDLREYPSFVYNPRTFLTHEISVKAASRSNPELYKLLTASLYIKVPIFVARQIRTSQVGFACSDRYVENEGFIFNEVSRRYVKDEPEYYKVDQWRLRQGSTVKQGSTGIASDADQIGLNSAQAHSLDQGKRVYLWSKYEVAPEQLRALLPQSMYTEFYMTGTLHRWAQFLALRLQTDVQQETRDIAAQIASCLTKTHSDWAKHYQIEKL